MNRQEQIEQLAKEITSGTLTTVKKQLYKTKLMNFVFEEVHKKIVEKLNHPQGRTLPETDKYDGKAFDTAFRETLTYTYGKADEQTGETIPFLKLFRARYTLKLKTAQKELLASQNPEQSGLREAHTREFLTKMADKYGLPKDERKKLLAFNVLNDQRCMAFLQHIGASPDDMDEYTAISQTTYQEALEPMMESTGETSPESLQVGQQTLQKFTQKERICEALFGLLDEAKAMAPRVAQHKTIEPFLPYFITLKVIGEYGYDKRALTLFGDYMDGDLWQYCKALAWNTKTPPINDLLSQYLSLRPDTIRKKMKIVQSFLLKVNSRCSHI